MEGIGVEAARQLGIATVAMKELTREKEELDVLLQRLRDNLAVLRADDMKARKEIDEHRLNKAKLLRALNHLNQRNEQMEEEVRLLEEEELGIRAHHTAAKSKLDRAEEEVVQLTSEVKQAEGAREKAALRLEECKAMLGKVSDEYLLASHEHHTAETELKRLKVSSNKCSAASNYVEALLTVK